jgi:adenosyl cobinamide kinase/adenosyl cobinamide phosphate guanylyltransferase
MGYADTLVVTRSAEGATVETDKRKRQVRAIWSTDEPDAYRTAFVQSGIDTSAFDRNPVILFEHGKSAERGTMPVANAVSYSTDRYKGKNVFIGTSRFWDDEFSDRLFEHYAAGRMRGWSVNVLPLEAGPPTNEEMRSRPDWHRDVDIVYRRTRLLEVSATALPGNHSTLTLSSERSLPSGTPAGRQAVRVLLADVNRLWSIRPHDGRLSSAALWLGRVVGRWEHPARRAEAWRAASAALARAAGMAEADPAGMSIEELELAIERLKLIAELVDLKAKQAQKEHYEAEAAKVAKMKAAYAAMCGKRA